VDGTDTSTSKHGDGQLCYHRHVDGDVVPLTNTLRLHIVGKLAYLIKNLSIGEFLGRADIITLANKGNTVTIAIDDVAIEAIVTDICFSTNKPFDVYRAVIKVEIVAGEVGRIPFLVPVELVGEITPESL
jgi:hypothetical protein